MKTITLCTKGDHTFCEDYYKVSSIKGGTLMAVADGHGSDCYCRASLGARFAVYAAEKTFLEVTDLDKASSMIKKTYDRLVEKHLLLSPLSECEKNLLNKPDEKRTYKRPPEQVYGTTLLIAYIKDSHTYIAQIGDGDITIVDGDGRLLSPLSKDDFCFENKTSSLCLPDALSYFRTKKLNFTPAALLLHTDGYEQELRFPVEAFLSLLEDDEKASLIKTLSLRKNYDDRTIILTFDEHAVKTQAFSETLEESYKLLTEEYRLGITKDELTKELDQLKTFIELAIPIAEKKALESDSEFQLYMDMLMPYYEKYEASKNQYISIQKQYDTVQDKFNKLNNIN